MYERVKILPVPLELGGSCVAEPLVFWATDGDEFKSAINKAVIV